MLIAVRSFLVKGNKLLSSCKIKKQQIDTAVKDQVKYLHSV